MKDGKIDLGPGALASKDGKGFVLSGGEWRQLQVYAADAIKLPASETEMRQFLGMSTTDELGVLMNLVSAYGTIKQHCLVWHDKTFPDTVSLADDVVHYNLRVNTYYDPLQRITDRWAQGSIPTDSEKATFAGIIQTLASDAQSRASRAGQVASSVKVFADQCDSDKTQLDLISPLIAAKYSADSDHEKEIERRLKDAKNQVQEYNDEVAYDNRVALSAVAYIWIPIFGWIAGTTVNIEYNKKAAAAQEAANQAQKLVDQLEKDRQSAMKTVGQMNSAQTSASSIEGKLTGAYQVVRHIEGIWSSIASDLSNLVTIIHEDIEKALPILSSLGIGEAKAQWAQLAQEVNDYRANAFISLADTPPKNAARVAPPRPRSPEARSL